MTSPAPPDGGREIPEERAGGVLERGVVRRVLDTLVREDAYGLRSRSRLVRRADGDWLRIAFEDGGSALVPIGPEGFQSDLRTRRPELEYQTPDGSPGVLLTRLEAVLSCLRRAAAPPERDGHDAFAAECRTALEVARLHARIRPAVVGRLARRYGDRPAQHWTGLTGALAYDTLAAFRDHPVYPTGLVRTGLPPERLAAYAPEHHPTFALRWVALPREAVVADPARLPDWWPTPGALGLPALDRSHLALPVHPLTVERGLDTALRATGVRDAARLADRAWPPVRPTLSMRTVAMLDWPVHHLKLPLPTATLGLRNRRTIKPGTLIDGAVTQRLLETVIAGEPRLAEGVLLADERTHLHAGQEFLAALVRRLPAGLGHAQVVPVAALLAHTPDGRLVADSLADRYYGGDLLAFLDAWLTLLFDVQTALFGYGIALESHQQNASLVLDETAAAPECGC